MSTLANRMFKYVQRCIPQSLQRKVDDAQAGRAPALGRARRGGSRSIEACGPYCSFVSGMKHVSLERFYYSDLTVHCTVLYYTVLHCTAVKLY
jgi:hypothetical protein